jgi:hypothetical protein
VTHGHVGNNNQHLNSEYISTEAGKAISTEAGLLADRGEFGRMVCLKGTTIQSVELAEAIGCIKAVDPRGEMVRMAKAIGICFGD